MDALTHRHCAGTNRHGEPCGNPPIPGGHVCRLHGGLAPQVQRSAKVRLLEGADLAIDYLLNLLTPRPPCEHCGRSDADRDPTVVRACQLVLDRSGFHPSLTVEYAAPSDKYANLTIDELIEHLETMLEQTRAMRDAERERARALPEATATVLLDDAYVVPEDEAPAIQEAVVQIPLGNVTPDEGKEAK